MTASEAKSTIDYADEGNRRASQRRLWLVAHRWVGLSLGVVGTLLGLTGSLLVFDGEIDHALNPQRYATTASDSRLPLDAYQDAARKASGARIVALQLPAENGGPVVAIARGREGTGVLRVFLDPPTARVLDVAGSAGFLGVIHGLHGSLMLRDWWGRELVGVAGVAMLVSALSGIYLWWPRRDSFAQALVFRPRYRLSRNLHHQAGFYVSIVLAVIAFTGIYLAFPNAIRAAVDKVSPVTIALRGAPPAGARTTDQRVRERSGESAKPAVDIDHAAALAREAVRGGALATISLPSNADDAYRIGLREHGFPYTERGTALVFVEAQTGNVTRKLDTATRTPGDVFLAWMMPLHNGGAFGLASQVVFAIVGFAPGVLFATGVLMWLRRRTSRRALAG